MKTARKYYDLRIQIRQALSALGMPLNAYPLDRMPIKALQALNSNLTKEYELLQARNRYAENLVRTDLDGKGLEFLARLWKHYNKLMLDLRYDRNLWIESRWRAALAN